MKSTLSKPVDERMTLRPRGTRGLLPTRPATVASFGATYVRNAIGVAVSRGVHAVPATPRAAADQALATATAPVRRSVPGRPPL